MISLNALHIYQDINTISGIKLHALTAMDPEFKDDAIVCTQTCCTPGNAVSGTAIVICSRHALIRRNGVGDLQKSKKHILPVVKNDSANDFMDQYCNIDFIIFAALVGFMLPWIFITYNISCQWSKNLCLNSRST